MIFINSTSNDNLIFVFQNFRSNRLKFTSSDEAYSQSHLFSTIFIKIVKGSQKFLSKSSLPFNETLYFQRQQRKVQNPIISIMKSNLMLKIAIKIPAGLMKKKVYKVSQFPQLLKINYLKVISKV